MSNSANLILVSCELKGGWPEKKRNVTFICNYRYKFLKDYYHLNSLHVKLNFQWVSLM